MNNFEKKINTFLDGFSLASAYFGRKFLFAMFILSVLSKSNSSLRSSQAFLSIIDLFNSEKYFSRHMIDCWLAGDNFRRSESDYFLDKLLTNLEPRDLNNGNSNSLWLYTNAWFDVTLCYITYVLNACIVSKVLVIKVMFSCSPVFLKTLSPFLSLTLEISIEASLS